MKKFALGAAIAMAGLASPAYAAPTLEMFGQSGKFGDEAVFCATGSAPCTLSYTYNIPVPAGSNLAGASITTGPAVSTTSNLDFLSATLNGTAFTLSPKGAYEWGFVGPLAVSDMVSITLTYLARGTNAQNAASYSGVINFANSAVPEPATWASMLVGFGLLGFAMRRRKENGATIRFA